MLMRKSNQRRQRVFRPQHVGDLGYRQQAGARVKQSRDNIQLQRTVRVQGDHPQLSPDAGAQHLPRHNIGVVLHFADDDVIPGADVGVPQLLATRLIPSVVPRTNTTSSADPALRKVAAC